ncbi:ABC transporter substrate-binding protein [Propylenella binzhouense]|uniref:Extracellular solute-binding protein n=1 Tax=Propylenella binzhouense TaxID=2555902 RepID=A0A964WT34_9HYPH|nr:extracellular solute-binding protein [Propylenella binzhouense]MYZ47599.1 extracellular solute-binding protein [Propylenella binzhouense]
MGIIRASTIPNPRISRRTFVQGIGTAAAATALGGSFAGDARAAGPLMWYSASSVESVDGWAKMYKEKTGNTVEYFRTGGVKLAQRFAQEAQAGQAQCGPIDVSIPGLMSQWARQGLLMEYDSPEAAHYPDDIRMKGFWTPIKALVCCMAYNADVIKPEEAPKHWEDLLDPKWKGKLVTADAFSSGATLHWFGALRSAYGKEFMEKLAAQDVLVKQGSGETTDTVVSGERPVAAMILQYYVFGEIDKGANLNVVFPEEGLPISYEVIGISKDAPDPEGSKKFVDFALSKEAQTSWQKTYYTPSMRDDVEPLSREHGRRPLSEVKRIGSSAADLDKLFEEQADLLDAWGELFK